MNKNYSFMLILLSCSLASTYTMDKPLARKDPGEQTAPETKKRTTIAQRYGEQLLTSDPLEEIRDLLFKEPRTDQKHQTAYVLLNDLKISPDSEIRAHALKYLGDIFHFGFGQPKDLQKAILHYQLALQNTTDAFLKERINNSLTNAYRYSASSLAQPVQPAHQIQMTPSASKPKKRAARGSKQYGTLATDIKILQPEAIQFVPAAAEQKNTEEATSEPKKRAARGSKQYGTLAADIKILQPGAIDYEQAFEQVKKQLATSPNVPLSESDYQNLQLRLLELLPTARNNIKAETYLLLGHFNLYGWGQPQNIKEANYYYTRATSFDTPFTNEATEYKNFSNLLQKVEQILRKTSLNLSQKLQDIKEVIKQSPYRDNMLFNEMTLNLIKKLFPGSNHIENAIAINSLGAQTVVQQQLMISNPMYYNDAIQLIKQTLFANNQPLLTRIYQYTPVLTNIINQWLEQAILHNKYDDIEKFIKAGASKERALTLAHQFQNSTVINLLNSLPGIAQPVSVMPTAPAAASISPAQPNISIKDQFITAVKQRKSTAELEALIQAGAEINYIDELSNNALIEAIQNKDAHLVKWLLDRGADPLLVVYEDENLGVTPDYAARLEDNADATIIKLIEDAQVSKLKILSSPAKPAAAPATSPRKVVPFKGFE